MSEIKPIIIDAVAGTTAAPPTGLTEAQVLLEQLQRQRQEFVRLRQITERINRGLHLEEILDFIFEEFRDVMPYNRIAYATLEQATGRVVARWARSDEQPRITQGYWLSLEKSSLREFAQTGRPRIINDLAAYAQARPQSEATRKLVEEKLRSSLMCPLVIEGRPVGFLFFNSQQPGAYSNAHIEFFMEIAGVIAVVIERSRMFSELADVNRRNQQELEMARKVQLALIPKNLPGCSSFEAAMLYEPAELIGGDLLDAIRLGEGRAILYVADAMGHGVPAALLMTVVSTAFRIALAPLRDNGTPSPAALLGEVNRTILDLFEMNYVTAACALVDAGARRVTLALAGHPPALLRRAADGRILEADLGGIPLGLDAKAEYVDAELPMTVGDALLLYTDGVTDAVAADGSRFGLPALKETLSASGGESVDALIERLRGVLDHHCHGVPLEDDQAILAVRMI